MRMHLNQALQRAHSNAKTSLDETRTHSRTRTSKKKNSDAEARKEDKTAGTLASPDEETPDTGAR